MLFLASKLAVPCCADDENPMLGWKWKHLETSGLASCTETACISSPDWRMKSLITEMDKATVYCHPLPIIKATSPTVSNCLLSHYVPVGMIKTLCATAQVKEGTKMSQTVWMFRERHKWCLLSILLALSIISPMSILSLGYTAASRQLFFKLPLSDLNKTNYSRAADVEVKEMLLLTIMFYKSILTFLEQFRHSNLTHGCIPGKRQALETIWDCS